MAKTTVVAMDYENSDSVVIREDKNEIQNYLNKGYCIKESHDDYFILVKSANIKVTLSNGKIEQTFNMGKDIMEHYGRKRMSPDLLEKFKKDVEKNKILLTLNSEESYIFY